MVKARAAGTPRHVKFDPRWPRGVIREPRASAAPLDWLTSGHSSRLTFPLDARVNKVLQPLDDHLLLYSSAPFRLAPSVSGRHELIKKLANTCTRYQFSTVANNRILLRTWCLEYPEEGWIFWKGPFSSYLIGALGRNKCVFFDPKFDNSGFDYFEM